MKIEIERDVLQQALDALEPLSAYGRVGSRDVEQAAAQVAILALREAMVAANSVESGGIKTEDQPPFGSKRKAAMAVYVPPFRFGHGYIYDSQNKMAADDAQVEGAVASRVRGWGRLGYMPNGAELQDEIGQMMADALNEYYAAQTKPVVEPVACLYTLEYGATVVNTTVSLHQLNYPFGVCGADYAQANDDGFSYVRQTPLYTSPTPANVPLLTDGEIDVALHAALPSLSFASEAAFIEGVRVGERAVRQKAGIK